MNPTAKESLASVKADMERRMKFMAFCEEKIIPVAEGCSNTAAFDFTAGILWISVYNREDLSRLMTLAPVWAKNKNGKCIQYNAAVFGDDRVYIHAYDDALPPTCKVVKTTRHVEAHTVEEETIQCEVAA